MFWTSLEEARYHWDKNFRNINGNWFWIGRSPYNAVSHKVSWDRCSWSAANKPYVFAMGNCLCDGVPQIAQGMNKKEIVELINILTELLAED